jgi:hypothetical protein
MKRLNAKLITVAAGVLITLASSAPAFAASTINISSSAESSSNVSINNSLEDLLDRFFGRKLKASLNGVEEVPGPGDPDGIGEARLRIRPDEHQLCIDIDTKYIDSATTAHVHNAPQGAAGAVVIPLPVPDSAGESHGCVDADNNLLKKIKDNPEDYYVNIHTGTYPDGAIRGQLSR